MKTQILAMLLVLSTLTAQAGNEGPQAAPKPPPKMIAQVVTGGGFAPPSVPVRRTIDVLADGQVQSTESYRDGHTVTKALAKLSKGVLSKLQAIVTATQAGELVDPNPQNPGCMDAPSITYYAILANQTKIAVASVEQCKQLERADASSGDYQIKDVLQGLMSLDNLQ